MVLGARQLKLITDEDYRRLCVSISARGWRLAEPNTPDPVVSRAHGYFFDEAGEHGMDPTRLAGKIACPLSWVREAFPGSSAYEVHEN
jgi:hypothetical protein